MKRTLAIAALIGLCAVSFTVSAQTPPFEIKGYGPGVDITTIDTSTCRSVPNIDSGLPGFRCDTTIAGDKAQLGIAVFDGKVVSVIFRVANAMMAPTLDALSQKYGRPGKPNQYIEDYHWTKGKFFMTIEAVRLTNGYSIIILDTELFQKARAAAAEKAKKDI